LVGDFAVAANECVAGDGLSKDFYPQDVSYYVLRFPVNVGVHEGHVVVAHHAVAQRRQSLLHPLHDHVVRDGVADVHQLAVCTCPWHQEPVFVS